MKYWQEDRFQKANKTNVPHLYLYTWIRASLWFALIVNSILMCFIIEKNSILEEYIFCLVNAFFGLGMLFSAFSRRKSDRTLRCVVVDIMLGVILSAEYVFENLNFVFLYFFELLIIIYFAIKIEKDNNVVDNNRLIRWWKRKKQEKYDRKVKKLVERNRNSRTKSIKTEKEKMKRMSRKQYAKHNL